MQSRIHLFPSLFLRKKKKTFNSASRAGAGTVLQLPRSRKIRREWTTALAPEVHCGPPGPYILPSTIEWSKV